MASTRSSLEQAILDVMAEVRGARIHQDTVEAVDAGLNALCERAERLYASPELSSALGKAEASFRQGDTAATVQHLSKALMEASRGPH